MNKDPRHKRKDGITTMAALHKRCRLDEMTGCLIWQGCTQRGLARVWLPEVGARSMTMALQFIKYGTRATSQKLLVPTCGNPNCATESHRKWGTRSELFKIVQPAMSEETRARVALTKRRASKTCTQAKVDEILASDETATALAQRLGMTLTHVCRIRRGEAWLPVPASAGVKPQKLKHRPVYARHQVLPFAAVPQVVNSEDCRPWARVAAGLLGARSA